MVTPEANSEDIAAEKSNFYWRTGGRKLHKITKKQTPISDEPGEFMWISKRLIEIDHSYQREHIRAYSVDNIAKNFNWRAFGVISVSKRSDGRYRAMTGQHRLLGAMRRDDVDELPCMVFPNEEDSIKVEAKTYIDSDVHRAPQTGYEKYKAAVKAEEPSAVFIQELVEKYNLRPITNKSCPTGEASVRAFGCYQNFLKAAEANRKVTEWSIYLSAKFSDYTEEPIKTNIFTAFFFIFCNNKALMSREFSDRMSEASAKRLQKNLVLFEKRNQKGTVRFYAQLILDAMNHGRRNRFELQPEPSMSVDLGL